jgi:hypothetical protein
VRLVTEQRQLPAPGSGRITGRCLQNPTRPVGLTLVEPSLFFIIFLVGFRDYYYYYFFFFLPKNLARVISLSLSITCNS